MEVSFGPCAEIPMNSRRFEESSWGGDWEWTEGKNGDKTLKKCLATSDNNCAVNPMYKFDGIRLTQGFCHRIRYP